MWGRDFFDAAHERIFSEKSYASPPGISKGDIILGS